MVAANQAELKSGDQNANKIQMQQQVQESGYVILNQYDQNHPQMHHPQQFVHSGNQYIPAGAMPYGSYYSVYPSQQQQHHQIQPLDCREIADFAVSNFNKVITILNRTGHARFRRAPIQPPSLFSLPPAPSQPGAGLGKDEGEAIGKEGLSLSAAVSTSGNSSSTFVSSITGEGSVSNGKGGSPPTFAVPPISASKPPLSGKRCREHNHSDYISGKTSGSSRCHCKKRCVRDFSILRITSANLSHYLNRIYANSQEIQGETSN